MKKILVIDDDDNIRKTLEDLLREGGYEACGLSSGIKAIEKISGEHFDLILLDIIMPEISGIDLLSEIKKVKAKIPIIMITAFPTVDDAITAVKMGACDYISKPFKSDELLSKIGRAIERAGFEGYFTDVELNDIFNALANPIRRRILKLIASRPIIRLTDITKELNIDDPSKAVFHLKMLKEGRVVNQVEGKSYTLTPEGAKIMNCLKTLENHLLR